MTNVSTREATAGDWRALRMVLPEAVYFGSGVRCHVAEDGLNRLVGAIAVSREVRTAPVAGLSVAVHVVPPWRGAGVEELLVAAGEASARARGLTAIYTWGAIEAGTEAHRFWRGLGFDRAEEVLEGRTDVAVGLRYLEPFWQQLVRRGKIPRDVRVVTLDQADPAAVSRQYVRHIGGSYDKVLSEILGESPRRFEPAASPVILMGDEIVGCILARRLPGGIALVEAVIIDTPFRGRWANIMLKREGWSRCVDVGIHTVLYYTHGKHRDTRRFVDKVGTTTREFVEPFRMLPGPPSSLRAG